MKKLSGLALAGVVVLISMTMGTTALAAPTHSNNADRHATVRKVNSGSYYNGNQEYNRESRQLAYEKQIDEAVANGKLTQAEADEYKADFDRMAEYCNNNRNNGYRSCCSY